MKKFTIGTPVRDVITARNMNEIADAVNRLNAMTGCAPDHAVLPSRNDIVRVRVSENFPKFAAVALSSTLITDPVNSNDLTPTVSADHFSSSTQEDALVAILQEPANAGGYAKAMISGVSFARIIVNDPDHKYAVPRAGSSDVSGLLESAETGPVRILAVSSNRMDGYPVAAVILGSGGAPGSSKYSGYFTITDTSEKNDQGEVTVYKVKVCDPRAPAHLQQCYVNSSLFRIAPWTSESLSSGTTYVRIHFNAGSESSGAVGSNDYVAAVEASTVIEASASATPSDTDTDVYYQIGRVEIDENGMTILQDHITGVARMLLYGSWCPEDEEEEE